MDNQEVQEARISAHKDTNLVTREQLAALPVVVGTDSFKPVAHIELVVKLQEVLASRDITIRTYDSGPKAGQFAEQFAISKDGMRLFGTLDLIKNGIAGTCASLGIRTANNKTMSLQMIAGLRVFVCDNMAFSGDTILMKKKHTSGLVLMDELKYAMDEYEVHYAKLRADVVALQGYDMTEIAAKLLMHDLFITQSIMPVRLFPEVAAEYFDNRAGHEEFAGRNAWSLLNAFTEVQKQMPLTTRGFAAQKVGQTFGKLVK